MLLKPWVRKYLAPDTGAGTGGAAPASAGSAPVKLSGVTMAERQSRSAQERDLSPQNEAIVPGLGDITRNLNTSGFKFENAGEVHQGEPAAELEPEPEPETTNEEAEELAVGSEQEAAEEEAEPEAQAEEEAEPEAEPEPEAQAEEAIGEVIEADGKKYKLPEAVQQSINSRIGKLTAKRKEAEEQLAAVTAEKDQLAQQVAAKGDEPLRLAPTQDNPLADVTTPADLDSRIRNAESAKLWAIENPDGAEIAKADGTKEFVEPARVRSILANAERTLAAAPRRREYLAAKVQADEIGRKAYPDLYKAGTPGNTALQQVRRGLPWLVAQFPDADLIIADAMLGKRIREGQAAQAGQRKPLQPAPAGHKPPQPKAAPRVPAKQVQQRDGKKAFVETRGDARSTLQVAESLVG